MGCIDGRGVEERRGADGRDASGERNAGGSRGAEGQRSRTEGRRDCARKVGRRARRSGGGQEGVRSAARYRDGLDGGE